MRHPVRTTLRTLALVLLVTACGDGPATPELGSPADLRLFVGAGGSSLATVVVEVTGPGIDPPLVFNLEVVDGAASGTITVPSGADRTITITAFDAAGIETHQGSATIDVVPGSNPTVTIVLDPLTGEQPLNVQVGTVVVALQPASATVGVGATVQLTATIEDQDGNVIDEPVSWATANPAFATVDGTGLVTGVAEGTAEIVATYGGVAGKAVVTVVAAGTYPDRPIVFMSDRLNGASDYNIWSMDANGGSVTRLTNYAGQEWGPSWSRDASRIAFWRLGTGWSLYTMDPDGGNQTVVLSGLGSSSKVSWSPDGTQLAYYQNTGSAYEVFTVNVDGSGVTQVTNEGDLYLAGPDWSPDGSKILFHKDASSNLYTINPDGSGLTQLTSGISARYGVWSPDGSKIAFSGTDGIYVMNADGTGVTQLTSWADGDLIPSWSPDGAHVVFYRQQDIQRVDADGSNVTALTTDMFTNRDIWPDWF